MASNVTNRTVSIYIDQASAEKSVARLTKQIDNLTQAIATGEKAGKDMSDKIADLGRAKEQLQQTNDIISGKMTPTFKMLSAQVSKLRNELMNMSKDAPGYAAKFEAFKKSSARLNELKGELSGVKKEMADLNKPSMFSRLTSGVGSLLGIGAGFAVFQQAFQWIKGFVQEGSQMAAQMEGVRTAFNRLNDPNLLTNLRTATKGTVSDLELMKKAVSFNNFGLPLDKLATALKFARIRAKETGTDVNYLVESIVTGIGRQSPLILDNLGISTKRVAEEFQKTGNFAEAAFKIIQEETAKSGSDLDTYAERLAKINADIANQQTKMGEFFNKLGDYAKAAGMDLLNLTQLGLINQADNLKKGKELYHSQIAAIHDLNKAKSKEAENLKRIQDEAQGIQIDSLIAYEQSYASLSLQGQRKIREQAEQTHQDMINDASRFYIKGTQAYTDYLASLKLVFDAFSDKTKNLTFNIFTTQTKGLDLGGLQQLMAEIDKQLAAPDLTTADKAKVTALKKKREQAQAEINKILQNTSTISGGGKSKIKQNSEQELKNVQDQFAQLQQQVAAMDLEQNGSSEEQAQAAIQKVIEKYAELIAKAKKYGAELAGLSDLEKKELDLLAGKQFAERSGLEYDESLRALKEYYDKQTLLANQNFVDGKTTAEAHAAELKRIEREELQSQIILAKDYAPTTKAARADLEKGKTEAVQQGVEDRNAALAAEKKTQGDADNNLLARMRTSVILSQHGSKAELDAKKASLQAQFDVETKEMDKTSSVYLEKKQQLNQALKKLDEERVQQTVQNALKVANAIAGAFSGLMDFLNARDEAALAKDKANNDKKKEQYQQMLDNKQISQEQYDKYVDDMNKAAEKKEIELKNREAKRQKAAAIFQAIVSTASAVAEALTAGPFVGIVLAALVGAMGALQIATIASTPPPSYRRGGIRNNKKGGVMDGPSHESGGIDMIDSQSGRKVGEMEGGETYMLLSKKVTDANRDIINRLLAESMSGGGRSVAPGWMAQAPERMNYGNAIETIHYTTHYRDGGLMSSGTRRDSSTSSSSNNSSAGDAQLMKRFTEALEAFNDNAKKPVKANIVWTEMEAKRKQYEQLTKTASLGG